WSAIRVSRAGWSVVKTPPVRFRRARGMLSLPYPVLGSDVSELRDFLNVEDDAFGLALAWLVAACLPAGPYPVLVLLGRQGSAKSSMARILRRLIDPNKCLLRSQPKDERDLAIAANNGWMIALDNLSDLPAWLSDALCRLATGGGFSTRQLYTDEDEKLF